MTAAEGTRVTPTQGNACRPETATRRRTNFPVIPRRKRERARECIRGPALQFCALSRSLPWKCLQRCSAFYRHISPEATYDINGDLRAFV